MSIQLLCGAAKRKITPDEKLIKDLRGLMDQRFGGIIEDLFVRVISIQNRSEKSLLITFDLDKVPYPKEMYEKIYQATGITEELVMMTAIHSHTTPIVGDRPFEGPNNIATKSEEVQIATHIYEDFIMREMLEAVRDAIQNMRPAKIGFGFGPSYINTDRKQCYEYIDVNGEKQKKYALGVNAEGKIDHNAQVIKFEDLNDKIIALFINYPVHCCVLHTCNAIDGKLGISGDIAGRVSGYLEDLYENSVAVWCSGAAGDINPIMQNEIYYPDPITGDMKTKIMQGDNRDLLLLLATRHYDDLKKIVERIECIPADDLSMTGKIEWISTPGKEDEDYVVRLHMMKLGKLFFLGASGELFSSFATLTRKLIPENSIFVINHEASLMINSGYIFDEETLALPNVDLPGSHRTNMLPGYFTEKFADCVVRLYKQVVS